MKDKKTKINKDVYVAINKMQRETKSMRFNAMHGDVSFDKSQEIRKDEDALFDKLNFFKNVVSAINGGK